MHKHTLGRQIDTLFSFKVAWGTVMVKNTTKYEIKAQIVWSIMLPSNIYSYSFSKEIFGNKGSTAV